jgi:nitroreductase/NAD-dependent dihydropyrimidine dehydrogenase PreA subunit
MLQITINPDLCKRDGICVQECPAAVFEQQQKGRVPEVAHEDSCIACGHCVAICPHGAIAHVDYPFGSVKPINRELVPSYKQVRELIRARRSARAFRQEPMEREIVEKIIDGARFAPSAHNSQGTEFLVVQDQETLRKIVELTADFLAGIVKKLRNPVTRSLLLLVAREKVKGPIRSLDSFERAVKAVKSGQDRILRGAMMLLLFHADQERFFAEADANLALQNATLVAQALGVGGFYTGYVVSACRRDDRIPHLLCIPEGHKVYGGLALGYPKFKFGNWMERKPAKVAWI